MAIPKYYYVIIEKTEGEEVEIVQETETYTDALDYYRDLTDEARDLKRRFGTERKHELLRYKLEKTIRRIK